MSALNGVTSAIVGAANAAAAGGFKVERSLRFNKDDSANLSKTFSGAGSRKQWTWSGWIKRNNLDGIQRFYGGMQGSSGSNDNYTSFFFDGNGYFNIGLWLIYARTSNAQFRDPSAWYHLVVSADLDNADNNLKFRGYINGDELTWASTSNNPSTTGINGSGEQRIGTDTNGTSNPSDLYLAEIHFVDGQVLAPTAFAEYDNNNNWNPKDCKDDLTYGTNGFYLNFSDNSSDSALGTDYSGNGNTWTVNNISAAGNGLSTANQGFDVLTYSGTGSTQSITGLNFQPDLVWTAVRDQTGYLKYWQDVVRGSTKTFTTTTAGAESTQSTAITSFDSGGFTVGSNAQVNESGRSMIAWCWKAGGSPSSNSDGSITTSVSVNTTYGFSIVSYVGNATSGATIGHGLGAVPKFVIIKSRDSGHDWIVYHSTIGNTAALRLNGTNMSDTNTKWFNDAGPSSSTFTLGNTGGTNENGDNMIAYCWSEISGFSKFGGFTHSGSASSVTGLGFTPRFVLIKRYSATDSWYIFDSARDTNDVLFANTNAAESAGWAITFNADGFSWIGGSFNTGDHMYAAFAAKPDESVIDSLIDTPTNYQAGSGNNGGNYATLNPATAFADPLVLSNGNLDAEATGTPGAGNWKGAVSTFGFDSGKWYAEFTVAAFSGSNHINIGINPLNKQSTPLQSGSDGGHYYNITGSLWNANSYGGSYGAAVVGDIIGVAVDMDTNDDIKFYKNGSLLATVSLNSNITTNGFQFALGNYTTSKVNCNFGQRPFAYPVSGYNSLCTQNLPNPTIADGSTAFDVALWTGNGSSQTVSSLNFNPDIIWTKTRSNAVDSKLVDTVRGISEVQETNQTRADYTDTNGVTSTSATGFSLGSAGDFNTNGRTYVGWVWDAGTSTVSNTDGSITSNVRANASAGCSIVTYTGTGSNATFGHGLGATPSFVIVKSRSNAQNWAVYHASNSVGGATAAELYAYLNSGNAVSSTGGGPFWNNTAPTSSVVSVGTDNDTNATGYTYVSYCFAPVEGFSNFGVYSGNGSADGPFVYTGFRPRWVMAKSETYAGNWNIFDARRPEFNETDGILRSNTSGAEFDGSSQGSFSIGVDLLSNGFKLRQSGIDANQSGQRLIYAAFAEHPFKTARAR